VRDQLVQEMERRMNSGGLVVTSDPHSPDLTLFHALLRARSQDRLERGEISDQPDEEEEERLKERFTM